MNKISAESCLKGESDQYYFLRGTDIGSSGSVEELVKCAPKVTNVNFRTSVSKPDQSEHHSGTVTILQGYSTIPPSLAVKIVVA